MAYFGYAPYVPVAQRRAKAQKKMDRLRKKGMDIHPISIEGRKITHTFWGKAWCNHLEKFSDYSNRLPRGRTYVRNGSVCHLEINKGQIKSFVSGSSLYDIEVDIAPLSKSSWQAIKQQCTGQIGSLLELLQGKLSNQVMEIVTDPTKGLFPSPKEIKLNCNCPDWAEMCKHVAAVLYGIGARLDQQPELLFILRGVDHHELISTDVRIPQTQSRRRQVSGNLSDIFGITLDDSPQADKKVKKEPKKKIAVTKEPATKKSVISKKSKILKDKNTHSSTSKISTIRPTGKSVIRLRKRFGMNLSQFSRLIGVSPQTISNWENQTEKLTLRPENLASLAKVTKLNKIQAWDEL